MNNWIPKNKTVKLAAVGTLLSIILYFVGLLFVFVQIRETESVFLSAESELQRKEKIAYLKNAAESNADYIQSLRNYFIQKGDEIKFIEDIEETARASKIEFEIVSIEVKAKEEDSYKEDVNVKMKVEGAWKNILRFTDRLEKMPFGVSIQNLNLNADTAGNWFGFVDFTVFREK